MTQQELSINDKKQICKTVLQRLIQVSSYVLEQLLLMKGLFCQE